ncbi:hypothetical protein SARC_08072 [Sphaeroforma arctica JP610]|uniref:Uncharacterized protein n=1 Tax=Sphaeroforma arctica JP610 TaxID=667725 RepID=A0A0L0FRT9_9EUKA|nr:hypothetical protein SARC_08072 [Sphaeroforma arctica JP610]KNC79537.1 hypothetical protein SARC_08072 [Sphaeroforma arctica JP610]|eukprot:XP_014153439.1 hypothetical protein SARC_08072 [Sphaeroforma arctica JP610]
MNMLHNKKDCPHPVSVCEYIRISMSRMRYPFTQYPLNIAVEITLSIKHLALGLALETDYPKGTLPNEQLNKQVSSICDCKKPNVGEEPAQYSGAMGRYIDSYMSKYGIEPNLETQTAEEFSSVINIDVLFIKDENAVIHLEETIKDLQDSVFCSATVTRTYFFF